MFLKRIYWALSARGSLLDFKNFPAEGTGYLDVLADPTEPLPWPWLSEEDLDYLVDEYMRTGPDTAFIGGLNSYRAMDVNWEHDPGYGRAKSSTPPSSSAAKKTQSSKSSPPRPSKPCPLESPTSEAST